jgi:predicted permease
MNFWRRLFHHKRDFERNMSEELRFHLEQQVAANRKAGMAPEEARRQARLQLGAEEGVKAECREERRGFGVESLWRDVRYALRVLLKNWRLATLAVFSLGVAMAICVVGLSVFNAVMLRPPAAPSPSRLVTIYSNSPSSRFESFSYPDFEFYRDNNQAFSDVAAYPYSISKIGINVDGHDESAMFNTVSDNYFSVLRLQPALGRFFSPGDDAKGTLSAVLSYSCWKRWGADPSILGKTLIASRHPFTIVGVAPREFPGVVFGFGTDVFLSFGSGVFQSAHWRTDRADRQYFLVARLKDGSPIAKARADIAALSRRLAAAYPQADKDRVAALTAASVLPPDAQSAALLITSVLIAIVLLVLLIACANVANLLLGLATSRRQEVLIRIALGASRARLVRQLLTETFILCAAGGAFGFALASFPLDKFSHFTASVPVMGAFEFAANFHPNAVVLGLTLLLTVIASLAAGLAPAMNSTNPNLAGALTGELAVGGTRKNFLRKALVVVQVTVCTLVMVGVGLCLRSVRNLRSVDPGFSARNLAALIVDLDESGLDEAHGRLAYENLRQAGSQLFGAESVSLAESLPLGGNGWSSDLVKAEGIADGNQPLQIAYTVADENYFSTLGIPLLAGRTFESSDTEKGPEVVVINHKMAETDWPGENPLGKHIRIGNGDRVATIVGVVADGKYSDLDEATRPFIYYDLAQHYQPDISLILRTHGDSRQWLGPLSEIARRLALRTVVAPTTFDDWMRLTLIVPVLTLEVVGGLGALALLLAAVGLYGTIFHSVSERRREIGIRVALGASRADLVKLFLRQTATISGLGVAFGLLLGVMVTVIFNSQFFGIHSVELQVLVPVALGMICASLLIAYTAARPWVNASPMDAVRHF